MLQFDADEIMFRDEKLHFPTPSTREKATAESMRESFTAFHVLVAVCIRDLS